MEENFAVSYQKAMQKVILIGLLPYFTLFPQLFITLFSSERISKWSECPKCERSPQPRLEMLFRTWLETWPILMGRATNVDTFKLSYVVTLTQRDVDDFSFIIWWVKCLTLKLIRWDLDTLRRWEEGNTGKAVPHLQMTQQFCSAVFLIKMPRSTTRYHQVPSTKLSKKVVCLEIDGNHKKSKRIERLKL